MAAPRFHDYESLGAASLMITAQRPPVLEYYSGTAIVGWYGNIEGQLTRMEERYRSARNDDYADKIHTFLLTWKSHPITGSMNVETLDLLEASSAQLAADDWQQREYFRSLRDRLRQIIASYEQLPSPGDEPVTRRRLKPSEGPGGPAGDGPEAGETPGAPEGAPETAGRPPG